MSSYLSYFTNSGAPSSQSSSLGTSTWSSTFSTRIAALRKALTKDSEEDDPDNEDCSHVSNVLRAYYTEKGRPFPEWLPPDPKKPAVAVVQQQQYQYGQTANMYGGYGAAQYGTQPPHSRGGSGGRAGLSDLWDTTPAQAAAAAPPQSLRAARPAPQPIRSGDSGSSMSGSQAVGPPPQLAQSARPLPSQRAGSYQTTQSATAAGALGSRDRLRAKLQGGGSGRSSPASAAAMGSQSAYSATGSYSSQGSDGGAAPYISASEPWSSRSNDYYAGQRQRPGGPR